VSTRYHLSSPHFGTYQVENDQMWDLAPSAETPSGLISQNSLNTILKQRTREWKPTPTFSSTGYEYMVELREGVFPDWLWFPRHFAVDFTPDYSKIPRGEGKRYVMRRAPNGPVTERVEPDDPIIVYPSEYLEAEHTTDLNSSPYDRHNRPVLTEFLYVHFQGEKYADWWDLPSRPIEKDEVLFMDREQGAQLWDSTGRVLFETTTADNEAESP